MHPGGTSVTPTEWWYIALYLWPDWLACPSFPLDTAHWKWDAAQSFKRLVRIVGSIPTLSQIVTPDLVSYLELEFHILILNLASYLITNLDKKLLMSDKVITQHQALAYNYFPGLIYEYKEYTSIKKCMFNYNSIWSKSRTCNLFRSLKLNWTG